MSRCDGCLDNIVTQNIVAIHGWTCVLLRRCGSDPEPAFWQVLPVWRQSHVF